MSNSSIDTKEYLFNIYVKRISVLISNVDRTIVLSISKFGSGRGLRIVCEGRRISRTKAIMHYLFSVV